MICVVQCFFSSSLTYLIPTCSWKNSCGFIAPCYRWPLIKKNQACKVGNRRDCFLISPSVPLDTQVLTLCLTCLTWQFHDVLSPPSGSECSCERFQTFWVCLCGFIFKNIWMGIYVVKEYLYTCGRWFSCKAEGWNTEGSVWCLLASHLTRRGPLPKWIHGSKTAHPQRNHGRCFLIEEIKAWIKPPQFLVSLFNLLLCGVLR